MTLNVNASTFISSIDLGNDGILAPFREEVKGKEATSKIFNDPTIYPHILDGTSWTKERLEERHKFVIENNKAIHIHGFPKLYKAREKLLLLWQLEVKGEIVGNGGLYWEPTDPTYTPEIFMYILQAHQKQKWGTKAFNAIIAWYEKNIFPNTHQPLRWLAKKDHVVSQKIANRLRFKPVMDAKGNQIETSQEGLSYLVFERKF